MFLSISLLQIPFRWSPERRRLEGHGRCNLRLAIHCDWVNTGSMSGTLTCWEKTTPRIWMFQMTCRLSTSWFFVRYLGFLLSVRDPENAWQWEMMRSTLTALMKPSHETGFPVNGKDPCLDLYSTCSFPRFKEDQTTIQPVPLISSRFEQRYKPTHNTSHFQGSKCIKCLRVLIVQATDKQSCSGARVFARITHVRPLKKV